MVLELLSSGGEYRISERISMVTENFVFTNGEGILLSYGIRFLGTQMSADLAFARPSGASIGDLGIGFGIPYVDFVYNF